MGIKRRPVFSAAFLPKKNKPSDQNTLNSEKREIEILKKKIDSKIEKDSLALKKALAIIEKFLHPRK